MAQRLQSYAQIRPAVSRKGKQFLPTPVGGRLRQRDRNDIRPEPLEPQVATALILEPGSVLGSCLRTIRQIPLATCGYVDMPRPFAAVHQR